MEFKTKSGKVLTLTDRKVINNYDSLFHSSVNIRDSSRSYRIMKKWSRSIAVVVGANNALGFEICKQLSKTGVTVVGFDIETIKIDELKINNESLKVFSVLCDVTDDDETEIAFQWVEETLGGVDILIVCLEPHDAKLRIKKKIESRYKSITLCSKLAEKSMKIRGNYGYIMTIDSTGNHLDRTDNNKNCQTQNDKIRYMNIVTNKDNFEEVGDSVVKILSAPLIK